MRKENLMRKKDTLIPASIFLLLSVVLSSFFVLVERQIVYQVREQYQYMAANQINLIKNGVDTSLSRVYTFKAMVKDHEGDTSFFDRQAREIYEETVEQTGIRLKNVAIAPGGVVEKVYPLAGNEALIGFDFMDEAQEGNAEAVKAYEKDMLVVTHPFELVQGGIGMGGRFPVFLEDENGMEVFWGLVTVTMDFEEVLKAFKLESLANMGASYELWYQKEGGERVTLASSQERHEDVVSFQFSIQNLIWHLDVAPKNGWYDTVEIGMGVAVIVAISMLIAILLYDKVQIKKANEQLEYVAHRDGLTGCYSRQYVNNILVDRDSGRWKAEGRKYSLAILDIDHFKYVNDNYGHELGDKAMQAISRVLLHQVKEEKEDCVIRHGGDEFILLYNDITKDCFRDKLESVLQEVQELWFEEYPDMKLSVSIGGLHWSDAESTLYSDMVRQADRQLYRAKENGRNQYVL